MIINKVDCITFFQENFMFDVRYNIIKDFVDKMIVCESKFDHAGNPKKLNFEYKKYNNQKVIYIIYEKPFPKKNNRWQNQALQREFILSAIKSFKDEDYIFFSDPDEIPSPEKLSTFILKKKYGIFHQDCFNYKFNLFNPHESPWEGTRVVKKKNLKSIDYMRQKVLTKNLKKSFWKFYIEKNLEIIHEGGWHFNNLLSPEKISLKLKSFAHNEFSEDKFSNIDVIKNKIKKKIDLFNRNHNYELKTNLSYLPKYILDNIDKFNNYIEN